jgi:hypothetical protein
VSTASHHGRSKPLLSTVRTTTRTTSGPARPPTEDNLFRRLHPCLQTASRLLLTAPNGCNPCSVRSVYAHAALVNPHRASQRVTYPANNLALVEMHVSNVLRSELVQALRDRRVLVITGTGITIAATDGSPVSSWRGLLEDGVDRVQDLCPEVPSARLRAMRRDIKSTVVDDIIVCAQKITSYLAHVPGNQFSKWLRDSIGALEARRPGILEAIGSLGAPIATTNYDTLLDVQLNKTPISWRDASSMQSALRSDADHIIHLHGHWQEPASIVFGYRSYSDVVGDISSQALVRAAGSLSTILFVGMGDGISDPNFEQLMNWLQANLPESECPPIALLREGEARKKREQLQKKGLNVLSYGNHHSDLELYLADLASESNSLNAVPLETLSSWDGITLLLNRLHTRIRREFKPDFVLSMSGPGNFAPAYCWSLDPDDIPLLTAVTFPKRASEDDPRPWEPFLNVATASGWLHIESSKWHVFVPNILSNLANTSRVLIFDDRVIRGNVQAKVSELLRAQGHEVRRAALVVHPDARDHVDWFEVETTEKFMFPWGGKYGRSPEPSN